jgi:hypothetical protein
MQEMQTRFSLRVSVLCDFAVTNEPATSPTDNLRPQLMLSLGMHFMNRARDLGLLQKPMTLSQRMIFSFMEVKVVATASRAVLFVENPPLKQ